MHRRKQKGAWIHLFGSDSLFGKSFVDLVVSVGRLKEWRVAGVHEVLEVGSVMLLEGDPSEIT